jgi:hypothetical protein
LAWMLVVKDGRAVVYESGSFFAPKTRGVTTVGRYVEGPEYAHFTSQGNVATTRDRKVVFEHNGRCYEAGLGAFRAALRNIPGSLTKQMLAADDATRQSMLFDFLLTPPESGGAGATVAAVGDVLLSGIAAATSLGNVNYDVSEGGGLLQEIGGRDSRSSSYQSVAKSSAVVNDAGAALMTAAGAYVGVQKGISLGGDTSLKPGAVVPPNPPIDTGLSSYRPPNVPSDWLMRPSKGPGGVRYMDPNNPHNSVRVMPGDVTEPHPNSQRPYVRWIRNGKSLDKNGEVVPKNSQEAHIPLETFRYTP